MAPRLAMLTALLLLAFAVPAASGDHGAAHPECEREGVSGASISNLAVNGVTLQTQAGSATFVLPLRATGLAASTTGSLDVEVTHRCVRDYTITYVVNGALGTTTGAMSGFPACGSGVSTHAIPIGNDVASVHIELVWTGCNGTTGGEVRDVTAVDPALPLY